MKEKIRVLKTIYLDPDLDHKLTVEAFDTNTPKVELYNRYLRLGMAEAKKRKLRRQKLKSNE